MQAMKARRSVAWPLGALAAAGAAALVVAEVSVRVLHPMDALVYQDSEDPALAFELRPGAAGMKNTVQVAISAQGLRDEPVASPRPPDERRVVVVGGYEAFGVGVPAEQTYVPELAEGLVDRGQGRARTVNLSMYSYRLGQKVELACRRLKELEPELAVLQVTEGDNGGPRPPMLDFPRVKNWIRERSALFRFLSQSYYLNPPANPRPPAPEDLEPVRFNIRRFKECAEAAGARAAIVALPDLGRAPATEPSEFRRTVESAAKEGAMPFFDGAPALQAVLPAEDRVVFEGSHFLSPAAHRALSKAVRGWLKPLLRRRSPPKTPPRHPVA
jgi:hypothetical protein